MRNLPKPYDTEEVTQKIEAPVVRGIPSTGENSLTATQTTSLQLKTIVYITNLPITIGDNTLLERNIRQRIEKSLNIKIGDIICYTKLGVGYLYVENDEIKDRLINGLGTLALVPTVGKPIISFVAELELVSYIVIEIDEKKKNVVLPTADEMKRRCMELYKCEKLPLCEKLNYQFPNIYKITFSSLSELLKVIHNQQFSINDQFARIYYCADCSFFEDLPQSVTEDKLRDTIQQEFQKPTISSSSIWIQLNKRMKSACIIVTDTARLWSIRSYIVIDGKLLSKKNNLTCRLRIYPVPQSFALRKITNHEVFADKLVGFKHQGENLIVELADKTVFDEYVTRKMLRVDNNNIFHVEPYNVPNNPEANDIDENTWYETEMPQYKPDIMQFILTPEHEIFRYKWNSEKWLQQFQQTIFQDNDGKYKRDRRDTPSDQIRHQLRVTVMLNTLAIVRKKKYMIDNQEIRLKINNQMKTIVYDQRSKLQRQQKLSFTTAPYSNTHIDVINGDCLDVYERLVNDGYNPLLLNMANAITPGGGYRKGAGAQEENIFRRSDYFRSLDVDLDQWVSPRSERFYRSSNCQLDPLSDHNNMYPMHDFGAIYTSGLTVFRQSEDTGYAYMTKPLENVCSLAMAAYRDPKLEGNMLLPKYTVGTRKKIENIFAIAFHHKHDSLVLSAFGCGAFKNPPNHVAQLFRSVIDQYAGFFKLITFAIIDDHNSGHYLNPEGNFKPFKDILDGMVVFPLSPLNRPCTMFGPYQLLSDDLLVSDVCIFDTTPCKCGAQCKDIYDRKHAQEYSHPTFCPHVAIKGRCELIKDSVHMNSFIHRNRCQYGGQCLRTKNEKHMQEYEHPSYCPAGSDCQDMKAEHLNEYRHLPQCPDGLKCIDYQNNFQAHCKAFRHCTIDCPYGNYCANLHDKQHYDRFEHPFPTPCSWTPFHCKLYMDLTEIEDHHNLSREIVEHCRDFAHVCRFGRNCVDKSSEHLKTSIHIARNLCPDDDKCKKLNNEDHLNSFTHPEIPDIRELCQHADDCYEREKLNHIIKFRHAPKFEHSGILRYFNFNEHINFVQNQKESIERITAYIQKQKWKPLPSGNISPEILNWIRTVQPVHRCNPIIFESILLHGHVMSRQYMKNLRDPKFVANSVLQHSRIRRINGLQEKIVAQHVKEYVIAVITEQFENKKLFSSASSSTKTSTRGSSLSQVTRNDTGSHMKVIETQEAYLSSVLEKKDLEAIYTKARKIADASINLHTNPSGIDFDTDTDVGTDKTVNSILGPHLGHYYGDVFIVFKREILHHPDANFTIQSATSFTNGNTFYMRPWLGNDTGSHNERVKQYHRSKLNASIPGYDYAAALELIALTSHDMKEKTMDIDLSNILNRWIKVDSHTNIEAHLPQLIPLSYIDHIYIPKNLFDGFNDASYRLINAKFKHNISLIGYDGVSNQPSEPRGPMPSSKSREAYQNFVNKELMTRHTQYMNQPSSQSVQGVAITIAPTDFTDHYVLPLTISQAYEQYCFDKKHPSPDQTTYIYWQVSSGDMILTLSNEPIETDENQPQLRCLTCYIAPKAIQSSTSYDEYYSYLDNNPPFKHHILKTTGKFAAKSNRFHIGCNTDDFMTFCLEIQRSTGTVKLTHAGPNSIYNHEIITYIFNESELDLTKLDFVHVSSGSRTVSIQNLIICFEKQIALHPTCDKNFNKIPSSSEIYSLQDQEERDDSNETEKTSSSMLHDYDEKKSFEPTNQMKLSKLKPCRDNVSCLLQYSSRDAADHNAKYSHPCRFSEICRNKEPHLTHEPHKVSMCKYDKNCKELGKPYHRAAFRHTDLPDFLVPCREQNACRDHSNRHRIKYSHGEQVYRAEASVVKEIKASPPPQNQHSTDRRSPCQWGSNCPNIGSSEHRERYYHPNSDQNKGIVRQENDQRQNPYIHGAQYDNNSSQYHAKYSHPINERQDRQIKDQRTPCKYGLQCHLINEAQHREKYIHLNIPK